MSGVRFSERNQEIAPVHNAPGRYERDDLSPEAQAELRNLSMALRNSRIQASRMGDFAFEPVSLPPSRVSLHCISVYGWPKNTNMSRLHHRAVQDRTPVLHRDGAL